MSLDRVKKVQIQLYGPILVLALITLYFSMVSDNFLSFGVLRSLLESAAIPSIIAIGLTFVILQGSIDLSIEGVVSVTAIVISLLVANSVNANDYGYLGIALVLCIGCVFGIANGLLFVLLKIPSFIVTIGTWFVGLGIATLIFPGRAPTVSDGIVTDLALIKIHGLSLIVFATVAVFACAFYIERNTRFGRMCFAIGSDQKALELAGINTAFYQVCAFGAVGLVAAVAGIFSTARLGVGSPVAGQGLLFPAVSAAVIGGTLLSGGRGGVLQSVFGVLILEVLRQGLIQTGANPLLYQVIQGAVIIIAVSVSTWGLRKKVRVIK